MASPPISTLADRLGPASLKGVVALYLFGSHARGTPHRDSDVDLGVYLDGRALPTPAARAEVAERFTADCIAALHHDDVQVVVLNDAPPLLARHVIFDGQPLWTEDPRRAQRFEIQVQLRAADLAPWLAQMRKRKLAYLRSRP